MKTFNQIRQSNKQVEEAKKLGSRVKITKGRFAGNGQWQV